jgi:hypothetical protein
MNPSTPRRRPHAPPTIAIVLAPLLVAAWARAGSPSTAPPSSTATPSATPTPSVTAPPGPFTAPGAEPFGRRGQVALPALLGLSYPAAEVGQTFSLHHLRAEGGGFATQELSLLQVAPTVDVFVADRWSVGASPYVLHLSRSVDMGDADSTTESTWSTEVGLLPRVGYAIPLGADVAFWPQAFVGVFAGVGEHGELDQGLVAGAELPVVFPLSRHVFVTAGAGAMVRISTPVFGEDYVELRARAVSASATTGLGIVLGR